MSIRRVIADASHVLGGGGTLRTLEHSPPVRDVLAVVNLGNLVDGRSGYGPKGKAKVSQHMVAQTHAFFSMRNGDSLTLTFLVDGWSLRKVQSTDRSLLVVDSLRQRLR